MQCFVNKSFYHNAVQLIVCVFNVNCGELEHIGRITSWGGWNLGDGQFWGGCLLWAEMFCFWEPI